MWIRQWYRRLRAACSSRAVLLLLVVAFVAVASIGVIGMSVSVLVAETVQGSGSAINVAGSLRRLTHRVGSLVVAERLGGAIEVGDVARAVDQFERTLVHPDLTGVLAREHSNVAAAIYRGVVTTWEQQLRVQVQALTGLPGPGESVARPVVRGVAPTAQYEVLLAEIDAFVEQLNTLVAVLEHDAEGSIKQLRAVLAVALALTIALMVMVLYVLRCRVFQPLTELAGVAGRIAQRDFAARCRHTGRDELGRVGAAFNAMADELSGAYGELERRVQEKTADLRRSNQSLELLYHVITRLYHAPDSTDSYAETLEDIERTLGLRGSFACVEAKHGGAARILVATSLRRCHDGETAADAICQACPGRSDPWQYRAEGEHEVLMVPLRDTDNLYGMLRLALPRGQRLADWQRTLVEAVSRHMGVALGITQQTERERLLALQEERSIIARELHDSLAQALSYMKIQASLLSPVLGNPARLGEAQAIVAELREGISAAYRQLRELLSSFRLRIEGDFAALLARTADEFAGRSGMRVSLDMRLHGSHLTPNQEIHVLHIIREALSNATRHSGGSRIDIRLAELPDGQVSVVIEDDGKGLGDPPPPDASHYGLSIMAERARGLQGSFSAGPGDGGGTRVCVHFSPQTRPPPYRVFRLEQVAS